MLEFGEDGLDYLREQFPHLASALCIQPKTSIACMRLSALSASSAPRALLVRWCWGRLIRA